MRDICPASARPKKAIDRCERLLRWWDKRLLTDISPESCRAYVAAHSKGGGRRDLEDLRSAINHHAKRKLHTGFVEVVLPARGKPRTKYLTRDEVAKLLWVCWRHKRTQRPPRGPRKGEEVQGETFYDLRHLARFILMGIYTGSRSSPILKASIKAASGRAYLDLESGLYYRLPDDMIESENKRSPVTRIYPRLLAHLRRWERQKIIAQFVVEWQGRAVGSVKNAWARAVDLAGIQGDPVPHTLRHTAVTWLKQGGASSFVAGDFAGMSEQMVDRVYKHHDPRFQQQAFDAFQANRSAGPKRDRNSGTNRDERDIGERAFERKREA